MKKSAKLAFLGLASAGALLASAPAASAAIVCNGAGFCWHTHRSYVYRPEYGVVVHPNSWRWGPGDHYAWHEHAGRGYWRDGAWVPF